MTKTPFNLNSLNTLTLLTSLPPTRSYTQGRQSHQIKKKRDLRSSIAIPVPFSSSSTHLPNPNPNPKTPHFSMSSSQALGGNSRPGRILGPSLDKIIKNVAWRKHSNLVSSCKSALDLLETLPDPPSPFPNSPLPSFPSPDADSLLHPLTLALDSSSPKIAEPALDCIHNLLSHGFIRCEIAPNSSISHLIEAVCRCGGLGDDAVELAVLKTLLAAVRFPSVLIRGELLVQIVKTCFNVYLGSVNGTNQICAKAVLAQMLTVVYARVEGDSMDVEVPAVTVVELLSDKVLNDSSLVQFVQNFVDEVVEGGEGGTVALSLSELQNGSAEGEAGDGESNEGRVSKIREDGFFLFKNLCKFSMKFSAQENVEDHILLRGKVLSLELLKVVMGNAGPMWRTNEK